MGRKRRKKQKRGGPRWQRPPLSAHGLAVEEAHRRNLRALRQPAPPRRRLILGLWVMFLATCAGFLGFFWFPSQSLVHDLRERGVPVIAEVVDSPKDRFGAAGNVKVRFAGPEGNTSRVLSDWGGSRPEGLPEGSLVRVVYDPRDHDRVLTQAWVDDPPVLTLPMVALIVVAPLLLAGAVALPLRRRKLLRRLDGAAPAPDR